MKRDNPARLLKPVTQFAMMEQSAAKRTFEPLPLRRGVAVSHFKWGRIPCQAKHRSRRLRRGLEAVGFFPRTEISRIVHHPLPGLNEFWADTTDSHVFEGSVREADQWGSRFGIYEGFHYSLHP